MKRKAAFLALILGLACSTPALAGAEDIELTFDRWTLKCDTREPAPGHCGVYWAMRLAGEPDESFLAAVAGYDGDRLLLAAVSMPGFCAEPASTMQVDGYPPVVLHPEDENAVIVPEKLSNEILRQALGGTMMFLRVHTGPDCLPEDHAVPLPGFADAWAAIPR